jgi:hypothetical protein
MSHFFYTVENSEKLKTVHSVLFSEIISSHLYDTGKGLALQVVLKEKVEDFEETKSNKGKQLGLRKILKNASVYITDLEDIKSFYGFFDNLNKNIQEMLDNAVQIDLNSVKDE